MRLWALSAWLTVFVCGADDDSSFKAFLAWLRAQGVSFGSSFSLGVDPATGLRGILNGQAVKSGGELFSVPKSLVLTTEMVQSEGVAWQSCSAGDDGAGSFLSPTHTAFALYLLEQRAADASWNPWISVMPDSFGLPVFYKEDELEWLQASPLRKVITLDYNAIAQDHEEAAKKAPGITLDDFRWARAAVKSRVFGLKSLSGGRMPEEVVAMVPFADFVNHPPDGIVKANAAPSYDPDTGIFRFVATRDIGVGEGIYWDYGFKSNRHSLLRYGFAARERVPLTDLPLFFKLTEFPGPPGTAKDAKLALIKEASDNGQLAIDPDGSVMHELSLSLTNAHSKRLLGHTRFMVLHTNNDEVLRKYCRSSYCDPMSHSNERRALKQISIILTELVSRYNTTTQEDEAVLESGKVSPGDARWNAVIIRYGEKKILNGFINLLAALDSLFDLGQSELADAIKAKWNKPESDIHRYVQQNITTLLELDAKRQAKRKAKGDTDTVKM